MDKKIIMLVVGSSIVTFILSVVFSINMVSIKPKNLASVIVKDPVVFMDAVRKAATNHERLSAEQKLEEQFKKPAVIKTKGRVMFGDKKAPITIVEFSDFQCPYCAKASERMKELVKKYDGKVNVVYKHFPLSFHPFAKPASEYFEAIALVNHNKAREFHDQIFDNFSKYERLKSPTDITNKLNALVKKIGLNISDVNKNLSSGKKIVEADLKEAQTLGVNGTPSFFVNGINARSVGPEMIIERLLKNM